MSIFTDTILPNLDGIAAVTVLVGGWVYAKVRGQKTKTVREILDDVVDQVLAMEGVDLENVKERAELELRKVLAKRKVTGKVAEVLVHEFVEYAAGELARRFELYKRNLERMYANAKGVGDTLATVK